MRSHAKVRRNNEIYNKHICYGKTYNDLAIEYGVCVSRIQQICLQVELYRYRHGIYHEERV